MYPGAKSASSLPFSHLLPPMPLSAKVVGPRKPRVARSGVSSPLPVVLVPTRPKGNPPGLAANGVTARFTPQSPDRGDPLRGPGAVNRSAAPVQNLVRWLIAETSRSPAGRAGGAIPSPEGGRSILLDIEVDGVRCLLVRQPRPAPAAAGTVGAAGGAGGVCLSPREREITRLITQGYPNKAIADVLDISTWTVCTHLRRIFVKFGVSSRAAMVARFLRMENPVGLTV